MLFNLDLLLSMDGFYYSVVVNIRAAMALMLHCFVNICIISLKFVLDYFKTEDKKNVNEDPRFKKYKSIKDYCFL